MIIDSKLIWNKIKNKRRLALEISLAFFCLFFAYKSFTSYNSKEFENSQIIEKLDERISKNEEELKRIHFNIDSIHLENKNILQKIDGTLIIIKKLDKKRDEKVKHIINSNTDSTISFLRSRYNKDSLSKNSLSK